MHECCACCMDRPDCLEGLSAPPSNRSPSSRFGSFPLSSSAPRVYSYIRHTDCAEWLINLGCRVCATRCFERQVRVNGIRYELARIATRYQVTTYRCA